VPSINSFTVSSESDASTPIWYRHDQKVLVTVTPEGAAPSNGVGFELQANRDHHDD
jgi:hypothetical protein